MKARHQKLEQYLRLTVERGASDLHLQTGLKPALRNLGKIEFIENEPVQHAMMHEILDTVLEQYEIDELLSVGHVDTSYHIDGVARYRANYLLQHNGFGAVFRVVPSEVPNIDDLNLPAVLKELSMYKKGMVIVTGPTGSGKSTTLAAMVNYINEHRKCHIMTIEDPIEFVHPSKKAIVQQRQVGVHAKSFGRALKAALRESPDIVLVGEMRDEETVSQALAAAETGHLVFGTLHTNSAAKTVDRIIDVFPADQQDSIRGILSVTLRAVVAQQLLKTSDGKGRVAAQEIMKVNVGVSGLIREGKTTQLPSFITMGQSEGMQSFDQDLAKLVREKKITLEAALEKSSDKEALKRLCRVPGEGDPFADGTLSDTASSYL